MEFTDKPISLPDREPMDSSQLYSLIAKFTLLPGEITYGSVTKEAFQAIFGSPEAAKSKNIVYAFLTEKPIPRVNGDSRVIYIGQTEKSLKQRYYRYSEHLATTSANSLKYNCIAKNYGPIRLATSPFNKFGSTLRQAEGQLLWWYFQMHCEFPPVNYTQTKVRNDFV